MRKNNNSNANNNNHANQLNLNNRTEFLMQKSTFYAIIAVWILDLYLST